MASAILHIKDCYYFEVPKFLARKKYTAFEELPDVWIQLDDHFQGWQAGELLNVAVHASGGLEEKFDALQGIRIPVGAAAEPILKAWREWQHHEGNHGKPFFVYLDEYAVAATAAKNAKQGDPVKTAFKTDPNREWYLKIYEDSAARSAWSRLIDSTRPAALKSSVDHLPAAAIPDDVEHRLQLYNQELSGKILIPQPFGRLRNLYEADSGFCISKYMVIELFVAIIMFFLFTWVAKKVRNGDAPKGKAWNLLESMLVFVKKDIAEKAIDHHYAHKYLPFLWTAFFFVLGCNLMGMVPWLGSPTASFGVTTALAFSTLFVVVVWAGMKKWGVVGFFKNLVPTIELPWYLFFLKVVIVIGLFFIELLGLLIKHLVLAIRLLANMVAGHLVLVSILFIAFELHNVQAMSGGSWYIAAPISILGVTALSLLELFVAFLQAYVFTFLSALFIDSVLHHH